MYYNNFLKALKVEIMQRLFRGRETREILKLVRDEQRLILDVGCNLGYLAYLMTYKNAVVIGIDANQNKKVLAFATWRNEGRQAGFFCEDAQRMHFEDDTFDYVVLSHVLEHFENPSPLLDEIKRVLKKDGQGRLIIAVPKEKYLGQNTPDHKLLFKSEAELNELLEKNGLIPNISIDLGKSIVAEYSTPRKREEA
jgi:2-polyprenyl-3-methyl-5-hydroxy-6-metoxy-1,4-benzoquinol methylase